MSNPVETVSKKKKSPPWQRVTTALTLLSGLTLILIIGGWPLTIAACVCLGRAIYEELHALRHGGHRPVGWVSYVGMLAGALLVGRYSSHMIIPIITVMVICAVVVVVRRPKPELMDILVSVLPLLSIVLPGMCLLSIVSITPQSYQAYLLVLLFVVPIANDTFAYFGGGLLKGPKLCEPVSPHKTISGAICGLVGGMVFAVIVGIIFKVTCHKAMDYPPFWVNLLVSFVIGVAGQLGDLFASLVKRHCKLKDFSAIFPGHGGMMDRIDSILFSAVVVYCYGQLLTFFLQM